VAGRGRSAHEHGEEAAQGQGDPLKELLQFLAKTLVDRPDQVEVREYQEDDGTILLELNVSEEDKGKVIGRHGRTAKALRGVMKAGGIKEGKRVLVEIVD
jgi:predicted RNA-binding protein YlqC (UPF0109 family)